jgi:hypothetical protein
VKILQAGIREGTWDQQLDAEATALAISCFLQGVGSRLPLPQEEISSALEHLKREPAFEVFEC